MKSLKGWKHSVGEVISAQDFENMLLCSEQDYFDLMWNSEPVEVSEDKPKKFEENDAQMRESTHG